MDRRPFGELSGIGCFSVCYCIVKQFDDLKMSLRMLALLISVGVLLLHFESHEATKHGHSKASSHMGKESTTSIAPVSTSPTDLIPHPTHPPSTSLIKGQCEPELPLSSKLSVKYLRSSALKILTDPYWYMDQIFSWFVSRFIETLFSSVTARYGWDPFSIIQTQLLSLI